MKKVGNERVNIEVSGGIQPTDLFSLACMVLIF